MESEKKGESNPNQREIASSTLHAEKKKADAPNSGQPGLASATTKKRSNKQAKRVKKNKRRGEVMMETPPRKRNEKDVGTLGRSKKHAGALPQVNVHRQNGMKASATSTGKLPSPTKPENGAVPSGTNSRTPQAHTSKVSNESTGEQQKGIQPSVCNGGGNVLGACNGCVMNGGDGFMVTGQGAQGSSPGTREEGGTSMPHSGSEHPEGQSYPSSSVAAAKSQNDNTDDVRGKKKKRAGGEDVECSIRVGAHPECRPAVAPRVDNRNQKASLLQGNGNRCRDGGTPNTVSDIQLNAAPNGNPVRPNQITACENTPPRVSLPAVPSAAECESKDKKTVVNGTTVRRLPQGDGLGPLKPWPSFDYGMSGEEYLTLFHQRNARLHALQGDNGLDASHPIEIDMDESMIQENPFMGIDWRQRDPMMFPGAYMGFFGMRPPMMPPMMMRGMEGMFDGMGMPMGLVNQRRREPETTRQDASQDREASTRINRVSSPESPEKRLNRNVDEEDSNDALKATTPKKQEDCAKMPSNQETRTPAHKKQAPFGQQMMKPMFPVPPQPLASFGASFPGLPFPLIPQGANTMPNFLAGTGDAPPKVGNPAGQSEHLTAGASVAAETPLPQPAVNPSTWVANLMGQVVAGVQDQNSGATSKEGEAGGVVFFHSSSFKPVEPPWNSKLDLDIEMEIDEVPFPDDPDFTMACFDDLDGAQKGEGDDDDDVVSYGEADRAEFDMDLKEPATVVLSETEEPKATRGCGIRGRGRRRTGRGGGGRQGNRLCGPPWLGAPGNIHQTQKAQRKKKIRAKGKDGKPRIYPRIPKITSLVPACVNGGLQKFILEDLESHIKDYVDDNDTLDRLVQDIESYLSLLHRFERNGQKTDWCEGCIEVILRGLQNSRVDPEEAKESGLIDSIQKTTKHRNGSISRAARWVLKEDWAVRALQILETEQAAKLREEAYGLSNVPTLNM